MQTSYWTELACSFVVAVVVVAVVVTYRFLTILTNSS